VSGFLASIAVACLAAHGVAAAFALHRLIVGPDAADRAVALDALTMVFIGILCILSILWRSPLYFDAVWILTLVGFLSSAAIARYLENGRIF
jgi:multisubunit Na+/H+ antiporter MnhF subunit